MLTVNEIRQNRASRLASELFCDDVLQCLVFEAEIGEHALELAVLFFKLLEPADIRGFHAAELGLPLVVGGLANAVFAANIGNLATAVSLFQNPNDLALRKSRFLHLALHEAIFTRNLYFSMVLFYGKAT